MFSGRYTFPLMDWGPLPYHHPVLAEVLKRNGFTTGLVADNLHLMEEGFGFGRGFDFVKDVPGQMHDRFQPPSTPMIELPCPAGALSTQRLLVSATGNQHDRDCLSRGHALAGDAAGEVLFVD